MTNFIYDVMQNAIQSLLSTETPWIAAIDGRCCAGKTTAAAILQQRLDCNVIHMDDFFLRPTQRTVKRLAEPGGNVDWERFQEEVLVPFALGKPFSYRPFDCYTMDFKAPVWIQPKQLTIVEGSYSCHPQLWDAYRLHIFLTVSPKEQLCRIQQRNGAMQVEAFKKRWIPLEERYFQAFSVAQRCEVVLDCTEGNAIQRSSIDFAAI